MIILFSQYSVKLTRAIKFIPHLCAAELTTIFVPISIGQYQEQEFPDRNGATAFWAIKLSGLQLVIILLCVSGGPLIGRDKMERTVFH
jgi:hypothetical protein